jgi:hypothetical protein
METDVFTERGIGVSWKSYAGYPEYPQLYPPFEHGVSVVDLFFAMGDEAKAYIRSAQAFE